MRHEQHHALTNWLLGKLTKDIEAYEEARQFQYSDREYWEEGVHEVFLAGETAKKAINRLRNTTIVVPF